jgi:hypothetical protein
MFTLIKREIEDNRVFFIGAIILALIFSVLVVYQQFDDGKYESVESVIVNFGTMISVLLVMAFCAMGAAQMYWDKTKKVSALLATLAVNRSQIFTARVIAGFLLVLIGFVPIAETIITAVSKFGEAFTPIHRGVYFAILVPAFVLGFACYCIGLQAGWTSNRVTAILGALGLSVILIPVILIKGFGWEIYAILVFLIAACLIRAWHKFSSSAL